MYTLKQNVVSLLRTLQCMLMKNQTKVPAYHWLAYNAPQPCNYETKYPPL